MASTTTFGERRTMREAAYEELARCSSDGMPIPMSADPQARSYDDMVLVKLNPSIYLFGPDHDVYENCIPASPEDSGTRQAVQNRLRWLVGYRLEQVMAANEELTFDSDPQAFTYLFFLSVLGERSNRD